jgi:DNA-directed RNA polymerase, mitochondrial
VNRIEKATRARFEQRERNRKGRKRPFVATDLGRRVLGQIIPPLAGYIASDDAPRPPQGLERVVHQVPHDELALIAVAALLNRIDTGWNPKDKSARLKICLAIGNDLRDQLEMRRLLEECPAAHIYVTRARSRQRAIWKFRRFDWAQEDIARAGNWLLDCATSLDFFDFDEAGFPMIASDHQEAVDRLREELIEAYPYYLPLLAPPPDWRGWRSHFESRISATFVRDSHPDTIAEIKAAFADGSMKQHVNGVNAIQRVPFVINEPMLPVVRALALELARAKAGGEFFDEEMASNLIKADLGTADFLAKRGRFWTPCNIDTRGRVYGLPHFNFQREDHVRSLFLFAEGEPIGDEIRWLEAAAAAHFGIKRTWKERSAWAVNERELIRAVAADPIGTFDRWRKASDPFSFVAACMELSAAEKSRAYVSRFPVLIDGSCNGIQHLALMTRDEGAGLLVNLAGEGIASTVMTMPHGNRDVANKLEKEFARRPRQDQAGNQMEKLEWLWRRSRLLAGYKQTREESLVAMRAWLASLPRRPPNEDAIYDLYSTVEERVRERLAGSDDVEAQWWLDHRPGTSSPHLSRALIKRPVMTFSYGVTESGAKDQIIDEYKKQHRWEDGLSQKARYLARLILRVAREELPRPAGAMKYIRRLTDHCTKQSLPLRWSSPTGLPIGNRYYKSNTSTAEMKIRGVRVEYRVADGWSSEIMKDNARNSAAANFVHSRDAAHLIRSVNAAVREGITSVVCVHDCFGTTAPRMERFREIINRELMLMYAGRLAHAPGLSPSLSHNPLAQLRAWNAGEDYPPPPEQGALDPIEVGNAKYTFK